MPAAQLSGCGRKLIRVRVRRVRKAGPKQVRVASADAAESDLQHEYPHRGRAGHDFRPRPIQYRSAARSSARRIISRAAVRADMPAATGSTWRRSRSAGASVGPGSSRPSLSGAVTVMPRFTRPGSPGSGRTAECRRQSMRCRPRSACWPRSWCRPQHPYLTAALAHSRPVVRAPARRWLQQMHPGLGRAGRRGATRHPGGLSARASTPDKSTSRYWAGGRCPDTQATSSLRAAWTAIPLRWTTAGLGSGVP